MDIQKYLDQEFARQRATTIEKYKQLNTVARKQQIVLAGSSLAEQFPINELYQASGGLKIYNRGVSGDVMDGLLQDLSTLILDLEPSRLFINIGSNDMGRDDYNPINHLNKYRDLLVLIRSKLPECRLHILSYYPVNPNKECHLSKEDRLMMYKTRSNANITDMNHRLMDLCQQEAFTYIDVSKVLMDEDGNLKEAFTQEGLHLWPEAYIEILEVLKPYLQ